VFSSHPIEWNLHRIDGLAEHFVYFNDDVFLINHTNPEDFFVNGLPCDFPKVGVLYAEGFFSNMLFNNMELINRNFSFRHSIRNHPWKWIKGQSVYGLLKLLIYGRREAIPGITAHHIHVSLLKDTFQKLWLTEYDIIHKTCQNRLRTRADVTPWCIRDWQLLSGMFYPKQPIGRFFQTETMERNDSAMDYLCRQKGKVICLNDSEDERDFELHKKMIVEAFEKLLPEKSAFEL